MSNKFVHSHFLQAHINEAVLVIISGGGLCSRLVTIELRRKQSSSNKCFVFSFADGPSLFSDFTLRKSAALWPGKVQQAVAN